MRGGSGATVSDTDTDTKPSARRKEEGGTEKASPWIRERKRDRVKRREVVGCAHGKEGSRLGWR